MAKDKVNIYDVAAKAEVGIGTVSRVLNNSPKVKTETRTKVLEVIKELNYRPNKLAQNLASQKANAIGIIVPTFIDHFFVEVLKGIQAALEAEKIDLILYKIDKDQAMLDKILDIVHSKKVDGIVAVTMDIGEEDYQQLLAEEIPIVLADEKNDDFHSIYLNDLKGAEMAIQYLLAQGHQKIAFINGVQTSQHGIRRLKGVKNILAKNDLVLEPELLKFGDFKTESGYKLMLEILDLPQANWPTAVFAASDNQAIGILEALKEKNIKVPAEIAVVGYDNIELAEYLKITTVWQPMYKLGYLSIEVLLKAIRGELNNFYQTELELKLIKRETA
ncbi:LacI family DNA-binding transcriptional regulator [Halanaerobium praevalens]|uniref:Transcriptional regulator, LacI family n=1 Tax=Halanaerobium praevalens (strain ATCC 33744 / DSM 2228 / GSL) TaxID=572479 RepID=E3DMP8_HALPG|nr:LacI family DNA-binding transcriptional regulator [Halanaerobium praevalens]ADO76372.1 transcriptional regulator, LacI family [Halanaerobium praevalens DSM 2228]